MCPALFPAPRPVCLTFSSFTQNQGEYRCTTKAVYRITEDGRRVARWDSNATRLNRESPNTSSSHLPERTSSDGPKATEVAYGPGAGDGPAPNLTSTTDAKVHRRISMAERLKAEYNNGEKKGDAAALRESNSDRLNYILEEPALRSLFREFLRGNFCEENLSFWLEVQDLKRKFSITSSAAPSARAAAVAVPAKSSPGQAAMEKHHESLIQMSTLR